jgi:hypothetical protein
MASILPGQANQLTKHDGNETAGTRPANQVENLTWADFLLRRNSMYEILQDEQ